MIWRRDPGDNYRSRTGLAGDLEIKLVSSVYPFVGPSVARYEVNIGYSLNVDILLSAFLLSVEGRKHGDLRPQRPYYRLIRDGEVGGQEIYILHLLATLSPPEWPCIKVGSCVSHFNDWLIVWSKSQDSVHKPHFSKRRERRAKADRTKVFLLTILAPYR